MVFRLWVKSVAVIGVAHTQIIFGLFVILFGLTRDAADNDRDHEAVLAPGRFVMERVLIQPLDMKQLDSLGMFWWVGWAVNAIVWGAAGGAVVVAIVTLAQRLRCPQTRGRRPVARPRFTANDVDDSRGQ